MAPLPGVRRRRALLSVTDKSGLADVAMVLHSYRYELIASGGTARHLREHRFPVVGVSDLTGFPEILGGRVKTLHPIVHGGILAARDEDLVAVAGLGIDPIDVVCVNLYRFADAARARMPEPDVIEAIDIGGPTLLRAAAKNFARVTVLSSPDDYEEFLWELRRHDGTTDLEFRRRLAALTFARVEAYDREIAAWFAERVAVDASDAREAMASADSAESADSGGPIGPSGPGAPGRAVADPDAVSPAGAAGGARVELRYGENPHQAARLEVAGAAAGTDPLAVCGLRLWGGKELSYNNLVDVVAALKLAADLGAGACAIIKHTNPCGAAVAARPREALEAALSCDPDAAFGGVFAFGDPLDVAAAELLAGRFVEVVAAPQLGSEALEILRRKKNVRLLTWDRAAFLAATRGPARLFGRLALRQDEDEDFPELAAWRLAAGREPDPALRDALVLAWKVAKHVKSNAVVIAGGGRTLGIGAGQMSRVDAARLAVQKGRERGFDLRGNAAASDGFFPFPDGLELLADAGVAAVVAPGGSIRDDDVAAAARARGIALLLTDRRHFRH